ncbi:MAG: T9SS type A sorting domain-containing protein [bacterium]
MKKGRQVFITVLTVWLLAGTHSFAQGNFTTEWESPVGWSFEGYAKLISGSAQMHIIFQEVNNTHNVRIYNGMTHNLDYSWTFQQSGSGNINLEAIFGIEYGYDFYTPKFDVTGDGINEIVVERSIVNPVNGNIVYTMGTDYYYPEIIDIDGDGFLELIERTLDDKIKITSTPAQTVSVNEETGRVKNYDLKQNYPNPFNPNTVIEYSISKNADVKVVVCDMLGRELKTLVDTKQSAGSYKVNLQGSEFSSGTYFYSLIVDGVPETKKMILVK